MEEVDERQRRFQPRLGMAGALAGALVGYVWATGWPDMLICGGVGFIIGGAASMFSGVWRYLLVFFALAAGFAWWLIHYVVVR